MEKSRHPPRRRGYGATKGNLIGAECSQEGEVSLSSEVLISRRKGRKEEREEREQKEEGRRVLMAGVLVARAGEG
ncbi:unnamed protein product [Nezara viridula]|uniref:Uncharacterized protein n=1 Tax=Nezara viridula TaxID=85310 RepID=A0A9P0E1X5_NEZVI|nr:unnamed protein product [Nezara viridula]